MHVSWMSQLDMLTKSERPGIDRNNHQLMVIRGMTLEYSGDAADNLRDLITARLLLRALLTDPEDYSGLIIVVQTRDKVRFLEHVNDDDRVCVHNTVTGDRAGLRIMRLKPKYIALIRRRMHKFEKPRYGSVQRTQTRASADTISRLRKQAASLFGNATPSEVFSTGHELGRQNASATLAFS